MNLLNKLERKIGKYAIPNLIVWLIGAYGIGFVLNMINSDAVSVLSFNPYYIMQGQIWRLVTWIFQPTNTSIFWLLIMMVFCLLFFAYPIFDISHAIPSIIILGILISKYYNIKNKDIICIVFVICLFFIIYLFSFIDNENFVRVNDSQA